MLRFRGAADEQQRAENKGQNAKEHQENVRRGMQSHCTTSAVVALPAFRQYFETSPPNLIECQ
jgi:hypothetical protein